MLIIRCEGIFSKTRKSKKHLNVNQILNEIYFNSSDFRLEIDGSQAKYSEHINDTFSSSKMNFLRDELNLGQSLAYDDSSDEYFVFESNRPNNLSEKKLEIVIFCENNDLVKCINNVRMHIKKILKKELKFEVKKKSRCIIYPYNEFHDYNYSADKLMKIDLGVKSNFDATNKWIWGIFTALSIVLWVSSFKVTDELLKVFLTNLGTSFLFFVVVELAIESFKYWKNKEVVFIENLPGIIEFYHDGLEKIKKDMHDLDVPLEREGR